jgi:hypothetical protein
MVKLQQATNGGFWITIPKSIIKDKKWKKGQELNLNMYDPNGNVIIREIKGEIL